MKDLHSNPSNTLLKMPSESQQNDADLTQSRKQISCEKQNKMKCLSTEINSDDSFELSLQSTVNSTGFRSRITNAFSKTVKNRRSRKMDASLKASDQHPGELSDKDVGNKNPVCETNALSSIRKIDRSTQYSDEDYATALNNVTRTVAHAVKSTKVTKNYISCKYCCRSFRHISAYTIHQRIHTGEKPYRCECCGKNFAQLSKLKSHRNVHFRSVLLPCPCCGKELSEKRDLMAHFMTHVKASKWNNEPSQEGNKPDAPIMGPTHSKRIICNVYNNKFPTGYLRKFHKHACDKLMSCKTCGQKFKTSSQLVAHKKTHWPVKPYACSICAKGFDRLKALKKHSERHTGDRPFSCSHCLHAFGDLPALRLHQLSKLCNPKPPLNGDDCDLEGFLISNGVHSRVNTPMFFKCQICKGHYQKWCQYTLHLQTHTKSLSYLCFACGQSYEKDSVVDVHCRVCCQTSGEEVACGSLLSESLHSNSRKCTSLKDSPPADLYTVEAPNGNSLSSAGQLHKNSQTPSNLQRDLMPESSQLIRASTLSGNVSHDSHLPSSPTPSVMTCVSLNESQECVIISPRLCRFKCPRCGQRYKRYRALCLHMQTHAPTFKYVCGPCGHSFERWNKLWLHQKIHRRKGQGYTCSQCNVQFHFFSSYRMHMLNHSEERPYTCPLCCQIFARELDLHVHQCSLQQPSRKLQCDVCSRTFSNSTNLLKHNLLHNGAISHQCLQCNLSFPNNKSLHEHLNTHSSCVSLLPPLPSEPFTFLHNCNRCKSSFSTGDLLFAHQICHTRKLKNRVQSTQSHESTSGALGGTRSSTNRSLLSTLDLDVIPKESLFKYPHPDKLYIPSHLSITSKRVPVINLVSADEDLSQEGSIGPSEQECPKISQENSENKFKNQPQVLESQGWSENFQDTTSHNSPTPFAETSVLLEGPAATVHTAENEIQGEIFECADCSEKLGSRRELFEHYFLHALGNTHL
ncbi:zinc finger protein 271 isoform X1 [Silurus meridionalis]|uniref:zinc finger protein 271 isoform X1 n=1 Tax=Silurus meridionalis TaxID=175797 RepID=UPI001EEA5995|nr:zinc finger protein 271 isoform X1 [Silurus meridionalis]XP_046699983.1 zinc finger protein 271 isoform X1 [Silurus meridionalis]